MSAAGDSIDEHHGSATFEDEQGENYKAMTTGFPGQHQMMGSAWCMRE